MGLILGVAAAYLLGSLPFGVWLARMRGVDIRRVGSGNTGATNVLRALGPRAAVPVLLLDIGKGFFGALIAQRLAMSLGGDPGLAAVLGGLGAFSGHNWSFLLGFSGGKGVAAAAGAALFLLPQVVLVAVGVFVVVIALTRYVSLGSILAAASFVVITMVGRYPWERQVFAIVGAAVIIYKHRANIRRLLAGTESKLGQRVDGGGKPQ